MTDNEQLVVMAAVARRNGSGSRCCVSSRAAQMRNGEAKNHLE